MVWFLPSRRRRAAPCSRSSSGAGDAPPPLPSETEDAAFDHSNLEPLLAANRLWAQNMREEHPGFFDRLAAGQSPEWLWIGCSDSRVPANQILGLAPGEVFVQRNVGNQALHQDMNVMACLEYAVKALKVKTVFVVGHYNCGAVKAALQLPQRTPGLVNCWISDIREARNQAARELAGLDPQERVDRLCELNVLRQVFHVCTSPPVQSAWAEGAELYVWGLIYDVADGLIHRLAGPFSAASGIDTTLDGFVADGARVSRCPLTHALRVHADAGSSSSGADSPRVTPGRGGGAPKGLSPAALAARYGRKGALLEPAAFEDYHDGAVPAPAPTEVKPSSGSVLRAQVNHANLVNAVIAHTTWNTEGEATTLATAARATASPH